MSTSCSLCVGDHAHHEESQATELQSPPLSSDTTGQVPSLAPGGGQKLGLAKTELPQRALWTGDGLLMG